MAEKLNIEKIKKEIEDPKYEVDYATPNGDGALFLPSISSLYAKHVSKDDSTVRKGDGPKGMTSIKDLDLLDPEKGIFWYPWVLYSAGHAQLDLQKTDIQESMIQKRNKDHTFVLADSGGYQLSTGVLKGNLGDIDNMNADPSALRHKILKWMEHTADFSMILDIPTTSCKNPKSIIYQRYSPEDGYTDKDRFYKCLEYTVKNNAYYIKHRTVGDTKLLNVLQGRDITIDGSGENDIWYNVVKYFSVPQATMADVKDAYNKEIRRYGNKKIGFFEIDENDNEQFGDRAFEGWAIPGNLKFDFQMMMKRFKIMAEDGFLENKDENLLIHFLGISRVSAGLLYTTLQTELRNKYNPNIIITYDAASPFVCTAKGKGYGDYTINTTKMTYAMRTLPDKKYISTQSEYEKLKNEPKEEYKNTFNSLFDEKEVVIDNTRIYVPFENDATGNDVVIQYDPNLNWHDYHKTRCVTIKDGNEDILEEPTTLGKRLKVKDICYKDGKVDDTKSYWDGTSYVYIMNMNVEQHIRAIQKAYQIYFQGNIEIANRLPKLVKKGKNAIEQIIRSGFSDQAMNIYLPDLKNILGMKPQEPDGTFGDDEGMEEEDDG